MTKRKTGDHPDLKMVNPNAAVIDIGSTMHMAAVIPDTDTMPVRAYMRQRERLCALVVIGVNARGEKHFLAIEDGVRESTQSWREVLLGLKTAASMLRNWRSAMGLWNFGQLLRKSVPPPGNSAAGCIRRATF
ncbi:Transposase, Mutator family [Paracoccus seriniphilus]|uniref:Transposase, Mutator family n=1 Tax=Paracoccus seriniphilus TaxID=184748 RepID=A0A239PN29_9RHOB|nr:Transposase, Mutator family [Paracoccus seriniphilus]